MLSKIISFCDDVGLQAKILFSNGPIHLTSLLLFPSALLCFLIAVSSSTVAAENFVDYDECLIQTMKTAEDTMTVSQVKQLCKTYFQSGKAVAATQAAAVAGEEQPPSEVSAVDRRVRSEEKNSGNLFTITPHKQNYILLASYNGNPNGTGLEVDDSELDNIEAKFQLSLKIPLAAALFGRYDGTLYAAYTMKSFWQAYNNDISSPFRETNHEPEMFLALRNDMEFFGFKNSYIMTGFSHQSNGQGGERSRSWNRLYLDFIFERGDFALSIKPWYRLPEGAKSYIGDPDGDDNPDISSYMGYGELSGFWSSNGHTLSLMLRNNLRTSNNRGAIELGWSFPLGEGIPLKGYIQYFNGYGESLIDYNSSVNRIGIGVLLTDWL